MVENGPVRLIEVATGVDPAPALKYYQIWGRSLKTGEKQAPDADAGGCFLRIKVKYEEMKNIIKGLPLPAGGLMLGLAAAGNLTASHGIVCKVLSGTLSFVLLLLLLTKGVLAAGAVREDLKNPAIAGIAGTCPMGIMVLSGYVQPVFPGAGYLMWLAGIALHCVLIIYFTRTFMPGFCLRNVLPSYFVVYVGIAAACLTAPAYNALGTGRVLFWFGFITYLILLPLLTYRALVIKSIPEPLLPTLTIFAAPASLCLVGYLKLFPFVNMAIFWLLAILALIMLFAVLLYLPKLLRLKFYPSYSAFTFPLVISAIALRDMDGFLSKISMGVPALGYLANLAEALAVVLVVYVLIRYAGFMFLQQVAPGPHKVHSVSK
ncbi:MAG: potassium-tellurite ethidium and proflavin transporter [Firmicutes bacterium ADurb.Bin456]|nr:MAG: potassium-tellurite ethidium and proflavin transporter [Firmicutes bacterium ADurb.Bin456]